LKSILSKISSAAKTDFVKVSAWSAISTLIKMITSFVSVKVVAKVIGPPGMALVGQFMNVITMISTLGTGCIGMGVTKYIAEHYNEPDQQNKVISNAVRITLVSTLLMSAIVILSAKWLGYYIFKTNEYVSLIIFFGASIGLYSFNMLMVNILNGFKQYKKFVAVNVFSSVAALILSILLVTQLGIYGALINCIASQSVIIIVTLLYVYKEPWFRNMFRSIKIDRNILQKLGAFSLMILVSSLMGPFSQLSIRSYITDHISLHDAGLWEAMNRLSSMYLLVVTTSISTFYLPRLSEIKDNRLIRHEIIKTAKIALPLLALSCLIIYLFRDIAIHLLFSREFIAIRNLFAFQMIGDFLKSASWLLAFLFWAKAMTKQFIITEVIFNLGYIFLARIFIDQFGLQGSMYAFALNYFIYLLVILWIFRKLVLNRSVAKDSE
jgi:O-antigen/teichoic acid export membrane protein